MKIDDLIRLIAILPRSAGEAMTTTVIRKRFYGGADKGSADTRSDGAQMRRIQAHVAELLEKGLLCRAEDGEGKHGKAAGPRYFLRASHVLSYFMHSQAALNLLWSRGVMTQLGDLTGAAEVENLAMNARLSERERVLRDRVRVVPDGVGREVANIDVRVMEAVVEAMETGFQVAMATKHRTGVREELEATVLGLVAKDGTVYMIGVCGFNDQPTHYPLHRVERAEVVRVRAFTRPEFRIDDHIREQHQLAHVLRDEDSPIELDLLVAKEALFHFRERPFLTVRGEQRISDEPVQGKWHSLKATVPHTVMLAPFLWSHAGWVQVLGPESIRNRVADGVLTAAAHYKHQAAQLADEP
jgi:predicted DNA-binding transcriptional regulator YafY